MLGKVTIIIIQPDLMYIRHLAEIHISYNIDGLLLELYPHLPKSDYLRSHTSIESNLRGVVCRMEAML